MNKRFLALVLIATALPQFAAMRGQGGQDETGPYDVVPDWLQPVHPGWYHHVTGVYAESPTRIFITASGETPIPAAKVGGRPTAPAGFDPDAPGARSDHFLVIVDANGRIIDEWKHLTDLLVRPHTVEISPYDLTRGRITYRERNAAAGPRPGGNRPGGPRRRSGLNLGCVRLRALQWRP